MSNELKKTLAFAAAALILTGAAFFKIPDRTGGSETFNDQGQKFFPELKDPLECTDLEVIEYDGSTASRRQFKVMFEKGRWVIPSHNNYPADAKDRLAKTTAGVIDLTKDTIRSDRVEDQEELGVLDPLEPKSGLKGLGKRVTLRDKSQKVLADFIIGNEVREHPGMRYVRRPDQKRIYGVNVNVDLSTKFADWIETNLLKLDASRIRSVTFDNHKVDPEGGRILPGEKLTIDRKDSVAPWTFEGAIPAGQELNTEKLSAMTTALSDLKIVGVRPKPQGISQDSKNDVKPTTEAALRSLVSKGFYPLREGLFSNQGEVKVRTDEGAVYTLRYGEVTFATGEELTAGSASEEKTKDASGKKPEGASENRYLMVTVAFDPSLVPEPEKPKTGLTLPSDPFWKTPDDPKRIAEEKALKEKEDAEKTARAKLLAEDEKKVKELSSRFADWYYVTPGDSFRAIQLDRAALIHPKPPEGSTPPGGNPAINFPGMPGAAGGAFPGLPQGHP